MLIQRNNDLRRFATCAIRLEDSVPGEITSGRRAGQRGSILTFPAVDRRHSEHLVLRRVNASGVHQGMLGVWEDELRNGVLEASANSGG